MSKAGTRSPLRPAIVAVSLFLFSLAVILRAAALGGGEESPYTIMTAAKPSLGVYLTDSRGKALYYSTGDLPGVSNCSGGCEAVWPPFTVRSIKVPSTLRAADFGYMTRDKGLRQVTYKGWPLYLYSRDWAPDDTNGQGLYDSWYVVQPALFGPSKG